MDAELAGLLEVYRAETAENLADMERLLLVMESRGSVEPGLMPALLRAAHTIKGNSAMVGYEHVVDAAHEIEDTLEQLRDGTIECSREIVTTLLDGVDSLRVLVAEGPTQGRPLRPSGEGPAEDSVARRTTLRVDVGRLDTLLDLTGEITISRGRLSQLVSNVAGADAALATTLWQLEQLHAALQGEVMALRMVPLGPVLDAQQRAVRDVAVKLDKDVRVIVAGHDVEVDTSIAEGMRDPLTHMVRNAVDHGIEPAAERLAAGKPAHGTVTLRASHQGGMVTIELADDGRGLDRDRIIAKAEAAGLRANAAALADDDVFALIFESGFSTAAEVTSVSGRGVGMDVVRRHVEALRGTIEIASVPGRGTTFTIRLPLTVAIISGFTVAVGAERYVLPLEAVEECVDFDTLRARGSVGEGILSLRGSALPYLNLGEYLGRADTRSAPTNPGAGADTRSAPTNPGARSSVVVIRHGDRRVGLVVDRLEGDCQAVIKPLGGALRRLPGISGSTILGNGRVALILNIAQLTDTGRTN